MGCSDLRGSGSIAGRVRMVRCLRALVLRESVRTPLLRIALAGGHRPDPHLADEVPELDRPPAVVCVRHDQRIGGEPGGDLRPPELDGVGTLVPIFRGDLQRVDPGAGDEADSFTVPSSHR